jgi:hypothetical protein
MLRAPRYWQMVADPDRHHMRARRAEDPAVYAMARAYLDSPPVRPLAAA